MKWRRKAFRRDSIAEPVDELAISQAANPWPLARSVGACPSWSWQWRLLPGWHPRASAGAIGDKPLYVRITEPSLIELVSTTVDQAYH